MEFFTKKIFENIVDDSVHIQFQKFSRGEFKDKAMIKIKSPNLFHHTLPFDIFASI